MLARLSNQQNYQINMFYFSYPRLILLNLRQSMYHTHIYELLHTITFFILYNKTFASCYYDLQLTNANKDQK